MMRRWLTPFKKEQINEKVFLYRSGGADGGAVVHGACRLRRERGSYLAFRLQ